MKDMAESIRSLASQLYRLKEFPKSDELRLFPGTMEEVVNFIEKWLESWSGVCSVA